MAESDPPQSDVPPTSGDRAVVEALLQGDRQAFATLVAAHHDSMLRVAASMLPGRGVAEEVVQETWMAILNGLPNFEGRSSLKTWMFRILTNRARTRGRREARTVPMSSLGATESPMDPDAFDAQGAWRTTVDRWNGTPEKMAVDREIGQQLEAAIETLPDRQRAVLVLRDVKGWTSAEVCDVMEISETNQRVLLHRARAKIRLALAAYLQGRV